MSILIVWECEFNKRRPRGTNCVYLDEFNKRKVKMVIRLFIKGFQFNHFLFKSDKLIFNGYCFYITLHVSLKRVKNTWLSEISRIQVYKCYHKTSKSRWITTQKSELNIRISYTMVVLLTIFFRHLNILVIWVFFCYQRNVFQRVIQKFGTFWKCKMWVIWNRNDL